MPKGSELDFSATIRGFAPGQKSFGRFKLIRMLGRGGMGVVWLAEDETLEREVALKFLPEAVAMDPRSVDDLKRETTRSLDLTHPHIVRIHDFFEDESAAAIAMEYVDGGTLAKLALDQPNRCFEPAQLLPWLRQLVDALDYAHTKAKVVHRDLKPANLMVTSSGDLKVTDFGISATVTDSVTRVSRVTSSGATPAYASPQQVMGERASAADDIYSLGATLYDLLTGKPPFHTGNLLAQVQAKAPPTISQRRTELGLAGGPISEAWEKTIAACLSKDPAQRPASAGAVFAALEGAELKRGPEAPPPIPQNNSAVVNTGGGQTPAPPQKATGFLAAWRTLCEVRRFIDLFRWFGGLMRGAAGVGPQILAIALPAAALLAGGAAIQQARKSDPAKVDYTTIANDQPPSGGSSPAGGGVAGARTVSGSDANTTSTNNAAPAPGGFGGSFGGGNSSNANPNAAGGSNVARNNAANEVGRPPVAGRVDDSGRATADLQPGAGGGVYAPPPARDTPPPTTGTVAIRSQPPGATVFFEGRNIGATPTDGRTFEISNFPPGSASMLFRHEGYRDATVPVYVRAGETATIEVTLEAARPPTSNQTATVPGLGLDLVWLQPGEFLMGRSSGDAGQGSDELPPTRVRITRGFWIGRTEVTNAQWNAVTGRSRGSSGSQPVTGVTWQEATDFCTRLTQREREAGRLPQGYVFSLPTEAQWEYACRAGTTGAYAGDLDSIAWYAPARRGATATPRPGAEPKAVGQKQPNPWGLYDMHGNVAEWTNSWYGPYPGGVRDDYAGESSSSARVIRGGAFDSDANGVRSAYRSYVSPGRGAANRGFRVALVPERP